MDAIAHECCTNTVKESKLKADIEKNGSPILPRRKVGRTYLRLSGLATELPAERNPIPILDNSPTRFLGYDHTSLPLPPYPHPPSPRCLISLVVIVDVKHHVLTYFYDDRNA